MDALRLPCTDPALPTRQPGVGGMWVPRAPAGCPEAERLGWSGLGPSGKRAGGFRGCSGTVGGAGFRHTLQGGCRRGLGAPRALHQSQIGGVHPDIDVTTPISHSLVCRGRSGCSWAPLPLRDALAPPLLPG